MPIPANRLSPAESSLSTRQSDTRISRSILGGAALACAFQLLWFGARCIHQIDYDGMAYTGIARHLRQGQFQAAINAFRSPLLSWIIALFSFAHADYVWVGKLCSIGAFVLCLVLLYFFARSLWQSETVAAVATLLLALGRGLCFAAVSFVAPDFLFAALVLVYFLVLLRCLREEGNRNWFLLGIVHGIAYLAKAFALPWLALCTLVAAGFSPGPWKQRVTRIAVAAVIPIIVAGSWATVLHSKYGVFTTGTQFRANFLQWTVRAYRDHPDPTYSVLTDTTQFVDEYIVDDPMTPNSWTWSYPVHLASALAKLVEAERRIIPSVLKEMLIVMTPGGVVAFLAAVWTLVRRRREYPVTSNVAMVIAIGAVGLVLAYSMLVFDARYLFPLIPLLLAIGSRVLVPEVGPNHLTGAMMRNISVALAVLGVIVAFVYSSSPFRQITRDFQTSCYVAGRSLKDHGGSTVVSIGAGPYPEHGVGWEAGYKAAYFASYRLVGATENLPATERIPNLLNDLGKASPDAILVWGRPSDIGYPVFLQAIGAAYPAASTREITDSALGQVGTLFFISR